MKKLFVLMIAAGLFAVSCSNKKGGGWSAKQEKMIVDACMSGVETSLGAEKGKKYCDCTLEKMKKRFSSYDELNEKGSQQLGVEIGQECVKDLGLMPGGDQ